MTGAASVEVHPVTRSLRPTLRTDARPRVLCVDDDERLLEGLALRLRRFFDVVTATSGAQALAALRLSTPFAVVISDMQMPNANGATFLSAMRRVAPETTRILLTGQADITSTIASVNAGEVFRILLKPIEINALIGVIREGIARHSELVAVRTASEGLHEGMVDIILGPLQTLAPEIAREAVRIRRIVSDVGLVICKQQNWVAELACILMHVASIEISPDTSVRWRSRSNISPADRQSIEYALQTQLSRLKDVPQADEVRESLALQMPMEYRDWDWRAPASATMPARVLYLVMTFEAHRMRGESVAETLLFLRNEAPEHDVALIDALALARLDQRNAGVALEQVKIGQRIVNETRLSNGVLFLPACHDVILATLEKLKALDPESRQIVVYVVPSSP
ncbi:MAG: response regulator [Gemmatimonadaceae bacterium]